jgi:hypothetical protein
MSVTVKPPRNAVNIHVAILNGITIPNPKYATYARNNPRMVL